MPSYSKRSESFLRTVTDNLQRVFRGVVVFFDNTVLDGHRGKESQNKAFEEGNSQVQFPDGKHNAYPSKAIDAGPYDKSVRGVNWDIKIVEKEHRHLVRWKAVWNLCRFYYFAGTVIGYARALGIKLRSGCDWDGDTELDDQNFRDLVHFEEMDD